MNCFMSSVRKTEQLQDYAVFNRLFRAHLILKNPCYCCTRDEKLCFGSTGSRVTSLTFYILVSFTVNLVESCCQAPCFCCSVS